MFSIKHKRQNCPCNNGDQLQLTNLHAESISRHKNYIMRTKAGGYSALYQHPNIQIKNRLWRIPNSSFLSYSFSFNLISFIPVFSPPTEL